MIYEDLKRLGKKFAIDIALQAQSDHLMITDSLNGVTWPADDLLLVARSDSDILFDPDEMKLTSYLEFCQRIKMDAYRAERRAKVFLELSKLQGHIISGNKTKEDDHVKKD